MTNTSLKVLQFVKDHGFKAKILNNGKIEMESPWYKPEDKSSGIDLIQFLPTFQNAKNVLGY